MCEIRIVTIRSHLISVQVYGMMLFSVFTVMSEGWSEVRIRGSIDLDLPPRIVCSLARLEAINEYPSMMSCIQIDSPTLEIHSEWLLHATVTIDQSTCDLKFLNDLPNDQIVSLAIVRSPGGYSLDGDSTRNENCLRDVCLLPNLRILDLSRYFGDEGAFPDQCTLSNLRYLHVSHRLNVDNSYFFSGITNLETLIVPYPDVDEVSTKLIKVNGDSLRELRIGSITNKDVFTAILMLPRLEVLSVQFDCHLNGKYQLPPVTALRYLDLSGSRLTGIDLTSLNNADSLEGLDLRYTDATDELLSYLPALSRLSELHLNGSKITDKGVEMLASLHNLKSLSLNCPQVTGANLDLIPNPGNLRRLHLSNTSLTDKHIGNILRYGQLEDLYLLTLAPLKD